MQTTESAIRILKGECTVRPGLAIIAGSGEGVTGYGGSQRVIGGPITLWGQSFACQGGSGVAFASSMSVRSDGLPSTGNHVSRGRTDSGSQRRSVAM